MCGIVGYTGTRPVKDILIEGLSRLEYRGYDSAGIAVEQDGKLEVVHCKGKVSGLAQLGHAWPPQRGERASAYLLRRQRSRRA